MGLLSPRTTRIEGEVMLAGQALHTLSARARRQRSGRDMAMIFQDPLASLNPVMTVGYQIAESLRLHTTLTRRQRQEKSSACSNRSAYPTLLVVPAPGPMSSPAGCASG
jgi:peptide/nickel transport system ATP-binding protein